MGNRTHHKIKIYLAILILILLPALVMAVNDVVVNGITAFQLYTIDASPVLTSVVAGSVTPPWQQATTIDVQNNYIDITLDNASSITFNTTSGGQYLQINKQAGSNDYTISPACVTSQATLTGTGGTVTLRLRVTSTVPGCVTPPPTTSGGGGTTSIFPKNYFVVIDNGASCTESSNVTVTVSAQNAEEVIIGNNSNFIGSDWEPYIGGINKSWALTPGDGWKTVYTLLKSSTNNYSQIISDTILVQAAGCPPYVPEPPEDPTDPGLPGGCTVVDCDKLDYNLYIINPDGSIRSMDNGYVQIETLDGAIKIISFEDSGSDFDYNDIKVMVDKRDCKNIAVTVLEVNGSWHHKVKIALLYNNVVKQDILLWNDSHLAIGETKSLNAYNYDNICEIEEPEPGVIGLNSGTLIKGSLDPVYLYTGDVKRHVFPSRGTYDSYYDGDFSKVKKISDLQLSEIALGSNMTYKPGVRMIKIQSDPKVYAVDNGAVLRWVTTEAVATQLYGADWAKFIDDVSPAFFTDYSIGQPLNSASDFPATLLPNISNMPVTPITPPSQPSQPDSCIAGIEFTKTMDIGSTGQEVVQLQKLLQCLGYFPDNFEPTTYYGEITESSVIKFQEANGIDPVGSVGPITRQSLNKY
jgi:putative peptidoglycan binding protein